MRTSRLSFFLISSIFAVTNPAIATEGVNASSQHEITITRDTFGTPHIYGETDYDLFYGYGYVLAEDRLYQLEMLKRSTQGMVAEVLGGKYADFDKKQRTLFWPDDIRQQISQLDENMQSLFKGYSEGINARIAEVKADPENLMPFEFKANKFNPGTWTDYDVVMMFVGSMLLRFGDFNTELENQSLLADLIKAHGEEDAWKIFNAVIPQVSDLAPTTIPKEDWQFVSSETSEPVSQPLLAFNDPNIGNHDPARRGRSFSNVLVLGPERLKGAKAVIVNGPQFGWFAPAYTYSVGFHSPSWNAVGNAPLGYPLPMFGYNEDIAWGSTWGVIDNVDIFRETLNPDDPTQYKHKGVWKKLRSRQEVIKVKGGESIHFTAYNSVHGPIVHIDTEHNQAYAKQRGWAGRELATLTGWIEATRAKNHEEWKKAVYKSGLNVNWYFADNEGNIGYGSMGAFPVRAKGHDNRLPVSGEGDMDWIAIQSPSKNPQVFNPSSHYIANWNNKPGAGILNPDEWWASWTASDRIKIIDDALAKAGKVTPDEAWDLMMEASFKDPSAVYFKPLMLAVLDKAQDKNTLYRSIKETLKDWDGNRKLMTGEGTFVSAGNGYQHPGNAIFQAWLTEMMTSVLANDLPGNIGSVIAHSTGYASVKQPSSGSVNIATGLKLLYEILQGRIDYDFLNGNSAEDYWIKALDISIENLTGKYGQDITMWNLPVTPTGFSHKNFLGIPQALPASRRDDMPLMNRGTENNMTVFKAEGVEGYEVVPPGQSGFIKPDGTKAKHFDDQYLMYQNLQKKQTWLHEKDVKAHTERTYTLKVKH